MPKGAVQMLAFVGEGRQVLYRTRDMAALFAAEQWGWSPRFDDSYHFATWDSPLGTFESDATRHVEGLPKEERDHAWPAVVSLEAHQATARQRRHDEVLAGVEASAKLLALASISPEAAYADLERRGLA